MRRHYSGTGELRWMRGRWRGRRLHCYYRSKRRRMPQWTVCHLLVHGWIQTFLIGRVRGVTSGKIVVVKLPSVRVITELWYFHAHLFKLITPRLTSCFVSVSLNCQLLEAHQSMLPYNAIAQESLARSSQAKSQKQGQSHQSLRVLSRFLLCSLVSSYTIFNSSFRRARVGRARS